MSKTALLLAISISSFLLGSSYGRLGTADDAAASGLVEGAGTGASATANLPLRPRRRLEGDGSVSGGDDMEDESASSSFDADEDVEHLVNFSESEPETEEDLEEDFVALNEKDEDLGALFVVQEMRERLRPRPPLDLTPSTNSTSSAAKQFAHLHHMKTGGTSVNGVINCALRRARAGDRQALPFASLEECGWTRYLSCTEGKDEDAQNCRRRIKAASAMQYCAPLFQMNRFGWLSEKTDVITVLRHPVDRVWSMFRFQTKSCYSCTNLLEIYQYIDNNTVEYWCDEMHKIGHPGPSPPPTSGLVGKNPVKYGCQHGCMSQLQNHQTRNLMTTQWESEEGMAMTDKQRVTEAIHNLDHEITVVGLTEELPVFRAMVEEVFPWMSETLKDDGDGKTCPLPHSNSSPKNNRCGADGSHWDLPDQPDDETREAILKHNQMDLELYMAAKKKFELQKKVLGFE